MTTTIDTAKMDRAFSMVCPAEHAKKLAAVDPRFAGFAAKASWKDPIQALVLQSEMDAIGVDVGDVCEAIRFYTATDPRVSREKIGRRAHEPKGEHVDENRDGWLIIAAGYRAGPAGG